MLLENVLMLPSKNVLTYIRSAIDTDFGQRGVPSFDV